MILTLSCLLSILDILLLIDIIWHIIIPDQIEEYDSDYISLDVEDQSDTEILGEEKELEDELQNLWKEDTTSCTCCTSCQRRRGKTGRKPSPFEQIKTKRGRRMRVTKRLQGLPKGERGKGEALAILHRLQRDHPDSKGHPVSVLSILTLIRTLHLSYNNVSMIAITR